MFHEPLDYQTTLPPIRRGGRRGSGAAVGREPPSLAAATGGKLKKYLEPLPLPGAGIVVATPSGPNEYSFTQTEIARQLHPHLPPTPLWAYDDGSGLAGQAGSFGMALVARSGTPFTVSFTHNLPATYPLGFRSTHARRRSAIRCG